MSDISIISAVLIVVIAFFAGMEGILDQFQFHQPLVSCTLIGLVTGHLEAGVILGGTLQMIALGWANIGAAVAPDIALAATASSIILIKGGDFASSGITKAYVSAIPLAVAGLFLTMIVRTLSISLVHGADRAAKNGNFAAVERYHLIALVMQGLRIAVPAALLLAIPTSAVRATLEAMPDWLSKGMEIGGGMVVAVGYALVINMMATREVWPFFAIGFAIAAINDKELTLISIGVIGVALALIYLALSKVGGNGSSGSGSSSSGDPIGDILEDY